jgi:tetratricopeptide (TPR) repeat protein
LTQSNFTDEVLAIREKAFSPDHPNYFLVARSLKNLAASYDQQGRYAEAEPLYKRSLAIYEKAPLGPDHPDVASSRRSLFPLSHDRHLSLREPRKVQAVDAVFEG